MAEEGTSSDTGRGSSPASRGAAGTYKAHRAYEWRQCPTFRHSAGNAVTVRSRYCDRHRNRHLTNGKAER